MSAHLDISKLEKVVHQSGKTIARCPACAEQGGDHTGNHLAIFPDGKFGCIANQGDADHRRRIYALAASSNNERGYGAAGSWRDSPKRVLKSEPSNSERLNAIARDRRQAIIEYFHWDPADVWEDSPQRLDGNLIDVDPAHFLSSLYTPDDLLWTGQVLESGQDGKFASRWRTCREWTKPEVLEQLGPLVTPAIWKPGTISRSAACVESCPYVVLDFDGMDGIYPSTEDELRTHILSSLAIIRWLRERLRWQLAAIISTGSKSLHAWFHNPPQGVLQSLHGVGSALGLDCGLLGHPEHPCRLPGHPHPKTGLTSSVLWLQDNLTNQNPG